MDDPTWTEVVLTLLGLTSVWTLVNYIFWRLAKKCPLCGWGETCHKMSCPLVQDNVTEEEYEKLHEAGWID